MTQTTPKGLIYPENIDHDRLWEHTQALAQSADNAISTVDANRTALAATLAFAMAAVSVTASGSGAASYTAAYTWPVSRFSQAPCAVISGMGGSGSNVFYYQNQSAPTTTGGTILTVQRDGAIATLTQLFHIVGIQYLSSSGFG